MMQSRTRALILYVGMLAALQTPALAGNWPQWRGPAATSVTPEKGFPVQWGGKDDANVLWKAELPNNQESPSSPIVWGDRVYVTTSLGDDHSVACYARADGKQLWQTHVKPGPWKKTDSRGGVCAPTPCTDGQRVYALFGTAVLTALDCSDGKIVWTRPLAALSFDVNMGSSPMLCEGWLILFSGLTKKDSNLTAFDPKTGEVKWAIPLPQVAYGHSTPAIATIDGKTQLIVSVNNRSQGMLGVDPVKGEILWSAPGDGETASPAIGSGMVYTDSGRGGGGYALDLAKTVGAKDVPLAWKLPQVTQDLSSPLIVGDLVYRLGPSGWLSCLKLATGEKVYSEKLEGVHSWVSPAATGDGLIYFASAGKSYVVHSGPALKIVATNTLPDVNHASPAFSDGMIFLKGRKFLWCIGQKAAGAAAGAASGAAVAAADPPAAAQAPPPAGQWVCISDGVLAELAKQNVKPAWPGQTAGIACDRTTGDVFLIIPGQGIWLSSDEGATFARADGATIGGRCETGYSLCPDPAGKRLACFMLDGKSAMTLDGGKTWTPIANVGRGCDWGAVDWAQPQPKTLVGRLHENNGIPIISQDGGKTWKQVERDFGPVGVFSETVFVGSRGKEPRWTGIHRSTDGGQTWEQVSDATPVGTMTVFKGVGYWLTDQGLLASRDQGKTWARVGEMTGGVWGPRFGKDESHIVVVDKAGFKETADGGKTWKLIAPYPPSLKGEFNNRGWMMNFAWDPIGRVCYVSRMGQPAYRFQY